MHEPLSMIYVVHEMAMPLHVQLETQHGLSMHLSLAKMPHARLESYDSSDPLQLQWMRRHGCSGWGDEPK